MFKVCSLSGMVLENIKTKIVSKVKATGEE